MEKKLLFFISFVCSYKCNGKWNWSFVGVVMRIKYFFVSNFIVILSLNFCVFYFLNDVCIRGNENFVSVGNLIGF